MGEQFLTAEQKKWSDKNDIFRVWFVLNTKQLLLAKDGLQYAPPTHTPLPYDAEKARPRTVTLFARTVRKRVAQAGLLFFCEKRRKFIRILTVKSSVFFNL